MRRKDREVTDFEAIRKIIDGCEIIRIGLADPDDPGYPYIVPLNFGYTADGENGINFYIHGARAGRKFELMRKVQKCSFEMECDAAIEPIPSAGDVTTRYKCVMGKADIALLSGDDAVRAIETVMDRRDDTRAFSWNRDALPRTAVWKLTVTELTAKANQPGSGPD